MSAATRSMDGVVATVIPLNSDVRYSQFCNNSVMTTIRNKIAPPSDSMILDIQIRQSNESISTAIAAAGGSAKQINSVVVPGRSPVQLVTFPIPVVIQLNTPLEFFERNRVLVSTRGVASPTNPNMFTQTVFEVQASDSGSGSVTIAILRMDPNYTLQNLQNEYNMITDVVWGDRLPSTAGRNAKPFTFTIDKSRCALVTMYTSHPDQLVVVFGPPPASAGGAKRKRVISRRLKSLNKKRKYTHRRFRRHYSYKRGRKN